MGIRAHDLGIKDSAAEVAKAAAEAGFQSVQLVLHKAIKDCLHEAGDLDESYARKIGAAFESEGLEISLLGAYFNWFTDVEGMGKAKYLEHLRLSRAFGTDIVGTEAQSPSPKNRVNNPEHDTEEVRELLQQTASDLIRGAEKAGVRAGFEGAWAHALSTPKMVYDLVEPFDSHHVALIFDLYNFLHIDNYKDQHRVIDEALELYGSRLAVIHCKDFYPDGDQLIQTSLGKGLYDYPYLLKRLKETGHDDLPLIFEGIEGEEIASSMDYLNGLGIGN